MAPTTRNLYIDPRTLIPREPRIAILLDSKFLAHRSIMKGISCYLEEHQLQWKVVLSSELSHSSGDDLTLWFDGIIADFNQKRNREIVNDIKIPVVGFISGTNNIEFNPKHTIISLDNEKIISMACEFLLIKGLENIAMYELLEDESGYWQKSRRDAYKKFQGNRNEKVNIFRGKHATFSTWMEELTDLGLWLSGLKKPCGVIVSSDERARFLLNACQSQKIAIPDEISIVSVGDITPHELFFNTVLSVVSPNHETIGEVAVKQLELSMVKKEKTRASNIIYAPVGNMIEGNSTDYRKTTEPAVIQALCFIRENFSRNIKVVDVLDAVKLSRSNIETKFKQEVGHSIRSEIHKLKMDYVCKLLTDDSLSIDSIAQIAGFKSSQQLYTAFKKEFCVTPASYREEQMLQQV